MKIMHIVSILVVLFFIVACVPEPKAEDINITVEEVKVVEEVKEPVIKEPVKKVKETVKEQAPAETNQTINNTTNQSAPSPLTGAATAGPRTVVAAGMIEVEEGETVRVVIPD